MNKINHEDTGDDFKEPLLHNQNEAGQGIDSDYNIRRESMKNLHRESVDPKNHIE